MKSRSKTTAQPKRPRKPRDTELVRIWFSPSGAYGPWIEPNPNLRLTADEARRTAKRMLEMADWIDAQKPRGAKRGRR
jgi:hypothetical protein